MNAFIEKFKCGGKSSKPKRKQDGGKVERTTDYDTSDGPELTRKQARKISKETKGYDRKNFNKAYTNAKNVLGEAGFKGKDKRMAARRMASGVYGVDQKLIMPEATFTYNPVIAGPRKYNEGVITTGDLTELGTQEQVPLTPIHEPAPAPVYGPAFVDDDRKTDAWYQYQYERQLFDQANHNYRPNQDAAAYQHWMWKDFNDAYDPQTGQAKRDFRMRVPTQDELLQFMNAGEFKHGALPMSRQRQMEYGVDPDARNWYFNDDSRYAVDAAAQNAGIPHTSNLYDGIANTMATAMTAAFNPTINVANIPGATATIDDMAKMYGYRRVTNSAPQFTGRSQNHTITDGFKSGNTKFVDGKLTRGRVGSYEQPLDMGQNRARWAEGPFKGRFAKNSSTGASDEFIRYMEGAKGNPSYQWYAPGFNKGGKLQK